jgi:hypothetical protein
MAQEEARRTLSVIESVRADEAEPSRLLATNNSMSLRGGPARRSNLGPGGMRRELIKARQDLEALDG